MLQRALPAEPETPRFSDPDAFLAWEAAQPERWELIEGVATLMVGAASRHHFVCRNLVNALDRIFRSRGCFVFSETFKLKLGRSIFYPDVMVVCPRPADDAVMTEDAILLIEVLSPSNRSDDLQRKFMIYQRAPSLRLYAMIDPERPVATLYRRRADGWMVEMLMGLDGALTLPEWNVTIPTAEIWRDLTLRDDLDIFPTEEVDV